MALFDLFGIGQAPDYMSSIMDEEQRKRLQQQATADAMINFGLNALQQGGYSRVPVGLGQIIGSAGQAAMKGYDQTMEQGLQNALMKEKIDEMKKQKDLAARRQAFLESVGKPNAVRQVAMQPTEQIPVAPMADAVAPNFQTQMQPPTMMEEKYYDPEKELRDALSVGAVDYGDMYALAAKKKAGTEILTPEKVAALKLPTNRGQVYQKNLDTGAIDLIQGTLAPEKPSFKAGEIQEFESNGMKVTREYQPDGTWKFIGSSQVKSGGEEAVDLLSPDAQKMMAVMYIKSGGVLPTLGAGKNAALMKSNIINMAALMQSGKSPDEAATTIINNKQNIQAQNFAIRRFDAGPQGDSTRYLNVAMNHLDTLERTALALKNNDIRLANSIYNNIAKAVGEPAPTDFDSVKKVVAGEIVKATSGSSGALGDRQTIEKSIDSANSEEQLVNAIGKYKELIAGQLNGLETQFISSTNRPASEFRAKLSPLTIKLLPLSELSPPAAANVQMKDEKGTYVWEYNADKTKRRKKYVN